MPLTGSKPLSQTDLHKHCHQVDRGALHTTSMPGPGITWHGTAQHDTTYLNTTKRNIAKIRGSAGWGNHVMGNNIKRIALVHWEPPLWGFVKRGNTCRWLHRHGAGCMK
jgi:hypothetical protein